MARRGLWTVVFAVALAAHGARAQLVCDGHADDPAPGTPEWTQRDADNVTYPQDQGDSENCGHAPDGTQTDCPTTDQPIATLSSDRLRAGDAVGAVSRSASRATRSARSR